MPDDPMSLFGSSNTPKKKKKEISLPKEEPPAVKPVLSEQVPQEQKDKDHEETTKMFEHIHERQKELDIKLAEIVNQGKNLPPELQDLLKDLSNWPNQKQDEILSKANMIIHQLNEAIGTGSVEMMERKKAKKDEKRTQKAQKIRGKRNWISMQ